MGIAMRYLLRLSISLGYLFHFCGFPLIFLRCAGCVTVVYVATVLKHFDFRYSSGMGDGSRMLSAYKRGHGRVY